jgi:MarR family transcriptional regulator, lower aerobic nicotinate degradation pathway regulator
MTLAGKPRELLDSPAFLLGYLGSGTKAYAFGAVERAGAGMHDLGILSLLDEGAQDTQAAIADALGLDRGQLVGMLDRLEQQGFVERHRDPRDRRRHTVSLTPAGRRQLAKLRTVLAEVEDEVLGPLDANSRAALRKLLLELGRRVELGADLQAG